MSDHRMQFFTPELYMRYNSPDAETGVQADTDWEQALKEYRSHLSALPLTDHARALSQQCFHDALLLNKTTHPGRLLFPSSPGLAAKSPSEVRSPWISPHITTLLLQNADSLVQILYSGAGFDPFTVEYAPEWPLWEESKRWLYDEVDVAESEPRLFVHRILWSDGTVLSLPFWDVSIVSVPLNSQISELSPAPST